jgi:hypothetical protein
MTLAFILVPILAPLLRAFARLSPQWSRRFASVLEASTTLFDLANGLGPRVGGRVFYGRHLRLQYDRTHRAILGIIDSTPAADWSLGMHYPKRWEPLFSDWMTLEDLVRYPSRHFWFHADQLAR